MYNSVNILIEFIFLVHYNCTCTCRPKRTLNSKKYGVDLIRYTHAANTAIHSSTKVDGNLISVKLVL